MNLSEFICTGHTWTLKDGVQTKKYLAASQPFKNGWCLVWIAWNIFFFTWSNLQVSSGLTNSLGLGIYIYIGLLGLFHTKKKVIDRSCFPPCHIGIPKGWGDPDAL